MNAFENNAAGGGPRQGRRIDDIAEPLSVMFHVAGRIVENGAGKVFQHGSRLFERKLSHGHRLRTLRDSRERLFRQPLLEKSAYCLVFRSRPTGLTDRSIVVIARSLRIVMPASIEIGPAPEAERRAAMNHIEIVRHPMVLEIVQLPDHGVGCHPAVPFTPMVQPSGIELRNEQRTLRHDAPERIQRNAGILVRPEIRGTEEILAPIDQAGEIVALEHRHVEARLDKIVADDSQIGRIRSPVAILVLDLDHQDGATLRNLQGSQGLTHLVQVLPGTLQEIGILRAQTDPLFPKQPPGKSAHIPLRTDIRSRTQNDPKALFLRQTAELRHIIEIPLIEPVLLRFRLVPEEVGTYRIEAHCPEHLKTMTPVSLGNPVEMHLPAAKNHGVSVE